jgi:hypothetical protein
MLRFIFLAPLLIGDLVLAQSSGHEETAQFLRQYCVACHQGKSAAGGILVTDLFEAGSYGVLAPKWNAVVNRVRNFEMPPRGAPQPGLEEMTAFVARTQESLKSAACSGGLVPGPYPARRLNRNEYSATIRDLLYIHLDVGADLPADGAGGEGFDNAAETLFISPIHAEKYLTAAKLAVSTALGDDRTRARLLVALPGAGQTEDAAAAKILDAFLPRAFRRPVTREEAAFFADTFRRTRRTARTFEEAIARTVVAVLISGDFLFRREAVNQERQMRPVDAYSLANRLSYFLWGSMPDGLLFDLAEDGLLFRDDVLRWQVERMLRSPKSHDFYTRLVEQWLGTRELSRTKRPDAKLFPEYADQEIQSDIRYQPIVFFQELATKDLSLLNLIDSPFTFVTRKLHRHYGLAGKLARPDTSGMPQRFELPPGSDRGGLLGMAAVLMVSSHPHRTSPVLRGKWLLESILGTPPPPPPPNVPELKQEAGEAPATIRELLAKHRESQACASCHDRIDPLGFALENYDVLGRWRDTEAGRPVDAQGELPDGTRFEGPAGLKTALLERKDIFVRHVATKMLGYALGRGLTLQDSCVVDDIVKKVESERYSTQTLIREIVFSVPFRYQESAVTNRVEK